MVANTPLNDLSPDARKALDAIAEEFADLWFAGKLDEPTWRRLVTAARAITSNGTHYQYLFSHAKRGWTLDDVKGDPDPLHA